MLLSFSRLYCYQYDLSIFSIFQNEASYLKEWIEFHKLVGVQHFYLYNNKSQDNYLDILAPYIENQEVELIQWPFESKDEWSWIPIHCQAYNDAIQRSKFKTKWLIGIDIDEFIFPVKEDSLVHFLEDYEEFGALSVNWQMYGTSDVDSIPSNCTMIETLIYRAPTTYYLNHFIKSIIRPEYVSGCFSSHAVNLFPEYLQVNSDKMVFKGITSPFICIDKIRINHYWSKDKRYLFQIKIPRREKWGLPAKLILDQVNNMNQIKDESILRFVPRLRLKMGYTEQLSEDSFKNAF